MITKKITVHPEHDLNVCTDFHGNPSNTVIVETLGLLKNCNCETLDLDSSSESHEFLCKISKSVLQILIHLTG